MEYRSLLRCTVVLCALLLATDVSADERRLATAVHDMFASGWKIGPRALQDAGQQYQQAKTFAGGDQRLEYGWTLILIKHRRYAEAIQRLDAIVVDKPDHRTALYWRIRVKMLTKQYAAALVDLETFSNTIQRPDDPEDRQAARFVGRMMGYLQGPSQRADNLFRAARRRIENNLLDTLQQDFDEGRHTVLDQYVNLSGRSQQVAADTRLQQQRERQEKMAEVNATRQRIALDRQQIDAQRTRLQTELDDDLVRLDAQRRQTVTEVAHAEAQLFAADQDLARLDLLLNDLLIALEIEPDPTQRALLRAELLRTESRFAVLDAAARRHAEQLGRQRQQLTALNRQRARFIGQFQDQLQGLQQRKQELVKDEKLATALQRKIMRLVSDRSPRADNLATRAAAFTTYETFPLDQEKQRVLRALAQRP